MSALPISTENTSFGPEHGGDIGITAMIILCAVFIGASFPAVAHHPKQECFRFLKGGDSPRKLTLFQGLTSDCEVRF